MLPRRDFLKQSAGLALLGLASNSSYARSSASEVGEFQGQIMTVLGPIDPKEMGLTLPHEHVLVDFVGADQVSPDRYDPEEAFQVALPYLEEAKRLGCRTLIECTPAYLGRDPKLLKRLSEATGLHLLTNTGFYNAGDGKYLPDFAKEASADQLAERWVKEWKEGIEDTEIRPGFIKIGMDRGPHSGPSRPGRAGDLEGGRASPFRLDLGPRTK
jgi:phosphotriesterase-related protein